MAERITSKAESCGGDGKNYFMFYCGGGYENNTPDKIAEFAKEHIENLKDTPVEEIKSDHLYWGSEYGYHGFYNGDTYVLYDKREDLPKNMRFDAEEAIERNKNAEKNRNRPLPEVPEEKEQPTEYFFAGGYYWEV